LPALSGLGSLINPSATEGNKLMATAVPDSPVDGPVKSAAGLKTAAGQEEVVAIVDPRKAFWIILALVRIFLPHLSF